MEIVCRGNIARAVINKQKRRSFFTERIISSWKNLSQRLVVLVVKIKQTLGHLYMPVEKLIVLSELW